MRRMLLQLAFWLLPQRFLGSSEEGPCGMSPEARLPVWVLSAGEGARTGLRLRDSDSLELHYIVLYDR